MTNLSFIMSKPEHVTLLDNNTTDKLAIIKNLMTRLEDFYGVEDFDGSECFLPNYAVDPEDLSDEEE
jgi:hypothetical protein